MKFVKQTTKLVVILLLLAWMPAAEAWGNTGHQLIAIIAYRQLTPAAREKVDRLTAVLFKDKNPSARFLRASTWPDQLRYQDVTAFNHWHFIDYPWSVDGVATRPPANENVVWALNQSIQTLSSHKARYQQQAWFLAFFIHFTGDAHQPLHCINRFSRAHPNGDQGGNLVPIDSKLADNLHSYWDQGVGLWPVSLRGAALNSLAESLMQQYPPSYFARQLKQWDPAQWAQDSFHLAQTVVYPGITEHSRPSADYDKLGQTEAAKQIVLAGYRCGMLLNHMLE